MKTRRRLSSRASFASALACGAAALSALLGLGCAPDPMPFQESEVHVFAGGLEVDGRTLNLGYRGYTRYCFACHGEKGDGKGPSSYGLYPPPRDFTRGAFEFARVRAGDEAPNDEDLARIVQGGLRGTAMLPWDIRAEELGPILQYVKTFAPKKFEKKRKNGQPPKVVEALRPPPDPWASAGKEEEGARRGFELYHFKAECMGCHPAYGDKRELYDRSLEAAKREPAQFKPLSGFREDPYGSVAKDAPEYGMKLLPPDFLFSQVRSIRRGTELADLYGVIAYGVYPVMPPWKDTLADDDIWALAHYVKTLIDRRDTPEGAAMKERFAHQAPFTAPGGGQ